MDKRTRGSVGWAGVAHLSLCFEQTLYRTFHMCFLPNFSSFGYSVSEEIIFFRNQPIRNKNCLWWPSLLTDQDEISNLYRGPSGRCFLPSFGWFDQAVSEEKIFRNRPIRKKNCLWGPYLVTNQEEVSILYTRPSMGASNQVSVHLANRFQRRRFFRNRPIKNKNCQWPQVC